AALGAFHQVEAVGAADDVAPALGVAAFVHVVEAGVVGQQAAFARGRVVALAAAGSRAVVLEHGPGREQDRARDGDHHDDLDHREDTAAAGLELDLLAERRLVVVLVQGRLLGGSGHDGGGLVGLIQVGAFPGLAGRLEPRLDVGRRDGRRGAPAAYVVAPLQLELEQLLAQQHLHARLEHHRASDLFAVDHDAVGAAQVFDHVVHAVAPDMRVVAGSFAVVFEAELGVVLAPDDERVGGDRVDFVLQGALHQYQRRRRQHGAGAVGFLRGGGRDGFIAEVGGRGPGGLHAGHHGVGARAADFFEHHVAGADGDHVARLDQGLAHAPSIKEGAVLAFEVDDRPAVFAGLKAAVGAGKAGCPGPPRWRGWRNARP